VEIRKVGRDPRDCCRIASSTVSGTILDSFLQKSGFSLSSSSLSQKWKGESTSAPSPSTEAVMVKNDKVYFLRDSSCGLT
ncbi:hypothetical protein PMAYCL1PPCAC_15989, partial [Pristionchus mayeri]